MSRRPKILGADGRPLRRDPPRESPPRPGARYDAAQTTTDNRRHWIAADSLSAKGANSLAVRKVLRERCRYEAQENNSYAKGMALTLANDLIGTGPRLQMLTDNQETNRQVEGLFSEWAQETGFAETLRTLKMAKTIDGEAFAILTSNRRLESPVKLRVRDFECDQVTDPFLSAYDPRINDGIRYDEEGNPVEYHVLDEHPGDAITFALGGSWVPAQSVLHWFRRDRPGQVRGVPEMTPALPMFAELRRYMQAVIAAAETAADFSAFMTSDLAPDEEDDDDAAVAMSSIEIRKRMLTTLPKGWGMSQLKPEQPATTLEMFVWVCMREIARCMNLPLNVALGDSSRSNYASGRLDYQLYRKALGVERSQCEQKAVRPVVRSWLQEGMMIPGFFPAGFDARRARYRFFWDGWEHVDPSKEGTGDQLDIGNRTQSRTEICARRGRDWEEEVLPQLAREEEAMRRAGLMPIANQPAGQGTPDTADPGNDPVSPGE